MPCHPSTHVTHSFPFPAILCEEDPSCTAKCRATKETCLDAVTFVDENEDCHSKFQTCMASCTAKCRATKETCLDAATFVDENEDCWSKYFTCMAQPASANKENVDNEGAGLRGSDPKTIVADV